MGGEVIMVFKKGEAEKARAALCQASYSVRLNKNIEADFWVKWEGDELKLGYAFGAHMLNSEFATAVGLELCRRFGVEKAGWDSIGYCKTLDDFTRSKLLMGYGSLWPWTRRRFRRILELEARRILDGDLACTPRR